MKGIKFALVGLVAVALFATFGVRTFALSEDNEKDFQILAVMVDGRNITGLFEEDNVATFLQQRMWKKFREAQYCDGSNVRVLKTTQELQVVLEGLERYMRVKGGYKSAEPEKEDGVVLGYFLGKDNFILLAVETKLNPVSYIFVCYFSDAKDSPSL